MNMNIHVPTHRQRYQVRKSDTKKGREKEKGKSH